MHDAALASKQAVLDRRESFIFSPHIAASFLRLVTDSRIFKEPSQASEAWLFVDALETRPAAIFMDMDPMAFGIFKHLCLVAEATGNAIPDAYAAALAIRQDATFVTADRFRALQRPRVRARARRIATNTQKSKLRLSSQPLITAMRMSGNFQREGEAINWTILEKNFAPARPRVANHGGVRPRKGARITLFCAWSNIKVLCTMPIPDWTSSGVWPGKAPQVVSVNKKPTPVQALMATQP